MLCRCLPQSPLPVQVNLCVCPVKTEQTNCSQVLNPSAYRALSCSFIIPNISEGNRGLHPIMSITMVTRRELQCPLQTPAETQENKNSTAKADDSDVSVSLQVTWCGSSEYYSYTVRWKVVVINRKIIGSFFKYELKFQVKKLLQTNAFF